MKNKKHYSVAILLLTFFMTSFGQQKSQSKVAVLQKMEQYQAAGQSIPLDDFFTSQGTDFQFSEGSTMQLKSSQKGINGMQHHRYQQFHQGLPVYGATYILHEKNGMVHSANGYFRPLISLDVQAQISGEEALQIALRDMNAKKYIWEQDFQTEHFQKYAKPQPKLCIVDPSFPKKTEEVALAYQIEIQSWEPFDKQLYFVNAHTGAIHQKLPLLHTNGVPAKGVTKYYGEQDIIVDSVAVEEFYLHDDTRGDGINTYDFEGVLFKNNSTYWDLTNEDEDEVALDAHYCSEQFYDLLLEDFSWDGIDNNGEEMNTVVHANNGRDFVNAYWDGTTAWFGDGDCNHGPLTTLEVVGHEFTHGVIQRTSNLTYAGESGAINEHLADVMGKALEFKEDPSRFSWTIGKSFIYNADVDPFRSMEDPASLDLPDFYKGALWTDGAGVHTNSSIGNHWFYLLSEGESGTNEVGQTYDITGLGISKAAQIVFHTNKNYLTESSTYNDYYLLSVQSAEELYGVSSDEVIAVMEAWKAVGLPSQSSNSTAKIDLTVTLDPSLAQQQTCLQAEAYSFEFTVTNLGTDPYYPDPTDGVDISYFTNSSNQDAFFNLEDTLLAGQSITYQIDNAFFIDETTEYVTFLEVEVAADENSSNNFTFSIIQNNYFTDNDIEIYGYVEEYNCLTEAYEFYIEIFNQSCNEIPAGTAIQLDLKDQQGNLYYNENIILDAPMFSNRSIILNREIAIDEQSITTNLTATLASDPFLSNNQRSIFINPPKIISEDYTNSFDDLNEIETKMNVQAFTFPVLLEYSGESYFATTSFNDSPFVEYCIEDEDSFKGNFFEYNLITGIVSGCLDFSGEVVPVADFDLIQFRNDNLPEPFEKSSMVQLSWEGLESGNKIIYGQEEGTKIHYSIELPTNFKGNFSLKTINASGTTTDVQDPLILQGDVNLIDNLQFSSYVVSTKNPSLEKLKLYPNPVTDQLFIENSKDIASYQIINAQGQILSSDLDYPGDAINLSHLADGYYWFSSINRAKEKVITPFVKLTK